MDLTQLDLFRLAEKRMEWADRRQQLLAQNVANANTPGWRSRDVAAFQTMLDGAGGLQRTSALHMQAPASDLLSTDDRPANRAPDGNGVSLEAELVKVADTQSMQQLALNLHRRYQSMLRLAMGRTG